MLWRPGMRLVACRTVTPTDNRMQCSGYDAGDSASPEVIAGGTFAQGSTTVSSVRCCSIEGDNSQPAQADDWTSLPPATS